MPHKTAAQLPTDDLDTEIALFRYGLIAPILHDPPPAGQQETLLRATASPARRAPRSAPPPCAATSRRTGPEALRPCAR